MGFLSPWFLAGMAAVALPLWLHLLRQFKRKPLPFSSLMFFEQRVQSSVRHRRLRYLALLALRLAVLLLLALAFAAPFITRTSAVAGGRKVTLIAVDRSFSMREGSRMRDAKAEAHRLVNAIAGGERASIATLDSHLELLTANDTDRGALHAAIDRIEAGDLPSSYGEFARALRMMAKTENIRLDAHLVSDMQQSSLPARGFFELQLEPGTSLGLHNVGSDKKENWAVESVSVAPQVYDPKQSKLTATIAGWQAPATQRKVSLLVNQKMVDSKTVNVPANGKAQVEFIGFDVPYGANRGEVRIEPSDLLTRDDSYFFSVERSDPKRVLFLYAAGRANEAFYYKAALESSGSTGLTVQTAPSERGADEDLAKFAFVVWSDPGNADAALTQKLCTFVTKGGGVLIVAGPNTGLAGKIPMTGNSVMSEHVIQEAGFVDEQHPAMLNGGRFENVQFLQSPRIQPKAGARIIAKLADGSPLLLEERMGEGRVLTFAGMLDNSTSDFPLHSSFVPFVVQTGHYLAGADDVASSVTAGTPVVLRHSKTEAAAADVIGPTGKRELPLSDATKAMSFELTEGGFYEIQTASRRRYLVAADADRRESDLTAIPAETLELWRNTGSSEQGAKAGAGRSETVRVSLWRYVLLAVLVMALVEWLFASRYLKEERQTA